MQMLADIFVRVLNLSLSGTVAAVVIMIVRLLTGKRLHIRFHYALWLLLAIKLAIPVSLESPVSLFNYFSPDHILINRQGSNAAVLDSSIPDYSSGEFDRTSNDLPDSNSIDNSFIVESAAGLAGNGAASGSLEDKTGNDSKTDIGERDIIINNNRRIFNIDWLNIGSVIWLAGCASLAAILILSYFRTHMLLKRKTDDIDGRLEILLEECRNELNTGRDIKAVFSGSFTSPFVFGFVKPRIVLPQIFEADIDPDVTKPILLHEMTHIKYHDPLIRLLMLFLSAVHWFNPVVWAALFWMSRDCEAACDAAVVKDYDHTKRVSYASALYRLAESRSRSKSKSSLLPNLAFGSSNTKKRIMDILRRPKHSLLSIAAAVVIIAVLASTLLTQAVGNAENDMVSMADDSSTEIDMSPETGDSTAPEADLTDAAISDDYSDATGSVKDETGGESIETGIPENSGGSHDPEIVKRVNYLLSSIVDEASASSNPYDYIKDNSNFRELTALGEPGMQIIYDMFARDHEDGLKEYVMAAACASILGVYDEKEGLHTTNGTEWFYKYSRFGLDDFSQVDADYDLYLKNIGVDKNDIVLPEEIDRTDMEAVISGYLLARKRRSYYMGEKALEAHHIYRIEEAGGIINVYMLVRFAWFGFENDVFTCVSGTGGIPVKMELKLSGAYEYDVVSYREPLDGGEWLSSLQEMFPDDLVKEAADRDAREPIDISLVEIILDKANAYLIDINKGSIPAEYKRLPVEMEDKISRAIYQVTSFRRPFPERIGSREILVRTGGPYPGMKVRCHMETKAESSDDGGYIITLIRTWDIEINGAKPISRWRYKVLGNRVTLIEEENMDHLIFTIK